jgi:CubicO group peptidase (beta-lactamase class C family)
MKTQINNYVMCRIKAHYCLKINFIFSSIFLTMMFLSACSDDPFRSSIDERNLEVLIPEDVGYSSAKLEEVKEIAETSGFDAMIVLYDGKILFSWGEVSTNYYVHSIRKPFLSALYGIHVSNGNINMDATLEELNIDDIPPSLTHEEKQATVRHLLQSRSGVYHEAAAEMQSMIDERPERGSHPPGTFYYYNNFDFNVAGVIYEQETGTKIFEEFKHKIASPIGMQDFTVENCHYHYELEKSKHPAYIFRMSARDMARFGALYQKQGNWEGKQIIPENWIEESTTIYSIADTTYGACYGYMWGIIPKGSETSERFGGYQIIYHTGLGGVQALIIIPELSLVMVQRTNTDVPIEDKGLGMELGMMIVNAKL